MPPQTQPAQTQQLTAAPGVSHTPKKGWISYPLSFDFLSAAVIGAPETVREGFTQLARATQANEFMLVSDVFDPALRLRSIGIAAEVVASCAAA